MTPRKKTVLKIAGIAVAYIGFILLLNWWKPGLIVYHTTAMYLVLIVWMLLEFIAILRQGRIADRLLEQGREYREQGLVAWTYAMHCKVRSEPLSELADSPRKAFCGCGADIGVFDVGDPEQLLKLAAIHMTVEVTKSRRKVAQAVADSEDRLAKTLQEIRDAPKRMREEAKRGDAV